MPQNFYVREGKGICEHALLASNYTTDDWKCGVEDWVQGSSGLWNWGRGSQGMVPHEFCCTVRLIQESIVKHNSSVVFWLSHSVVATKVKNEFSLFQEKDGSNKTIVICARYSDDTPYLDDT